MTDPKASAPPPPPIDWEAIAADLKQYGHDVADRVGGQLNLRGGDAKKGEYTVDKLLDDVKAFWHAVADDIDRGIESWKKHVEHRGDGS